RITYTGVAMHEGVLPGYPASHGCIRMPREFARRMYGITAGNERVVITQQDIIPVEIAHPRLPAPKFMAAGLGTKPSKSAGATVNGDGPGNPSDEGNGPASALNPLDFAKAMKVRAAKQAGDAEGAIEPARQAAELKARHARAAAVEYRKAEIAVAAANERF